MKGELERDQRPAPCTPDYISRWKGRFEAERLGGLYADIGARPGR